MALNKTGSVAGDKRDRCLFLFLYIHLVVCLCSSRTGNQTLPRRELARLISVSMHSLAPNSPPSFHGSPTSPIDLHLLSSGFSDNGCESPTMAALHRFLPSNNEDSWSQEDLYACDEFRMFEFKVRRCMRGRSHDWTECPFAHPGEKARRRDPRKFHYSGTACPDFRKGCCKNGDSCDLAHGVFECWLHPARYRTQPCKDGRSCKRKVCFFAHTPLQLRLPLSAAQQLPSPPMSPLSDNNSPPLSPCATARDIALLRYAAAMADVAAAASAVPPRYMERMNSLPVNLNEADRRSRLMGQSASFNGRSNNVKGLVSALQRQLELNEAHGLGAGYPYGGFGSPPVSPYARSPLYRSCSGWSEGGMEYPEAEIFQTRVESGRDLRAKIYGKMMKDNLPECGECPDLGWVNELVAIN